MLVLLFSCSTESVLSVNPDVLDFGEVNFQEEMPAGGYSPLELSIENSSNKDVNLQLWDVDLTHLCLEGFDSPSPELGSLGAGSKYILVVSVCDYIEENGERDDLIQGDIQIDDGKNILSVPWSFTPVLNIPSDTGQ